MSEKAANKLACAVICIGLAYLGFEHDSGWAFFGSVVAFLFGLD